MDLIDDHRLNYEPDRLDFKNRELQKKYEELAEAHEETENEKKKRLKLQAILEEHGIPYEDEF